jgi:hypothetical protein
MAGIAKKNCGEIGGKAPEAKVYLSIFYHLLQKGQRKVGAWTAVAGGNGNGGVSPRCW